MGLIINGFDLSKVFLGCKEFYYHSCKLHEVSEYIISDKGFTNTSINWFICHLFDKSKDFIDKLIKSLILIRLKEENKEMISFNKKDLELELKEV